MLLRPHALCAVPRRIDGARSLQAARPHRASCTSPAPSARSGPTPQCTPVHPSTLQHSPVHPSTPRCTPASVCPSPCSAPWEAAESPWGGGPPGSVAGDGGDRGCSSQGEKPALAQQRPLPSFLSFFLRGSLVSPSKDHALSTASTILTWSNFLRVATLQMHALLIKSQTSLFHRFM